jgi:hypothetical protein
LVFVPGSFGFVAPDLVFLPTEFGFVALDLENHPTVSARLKWL